MNYLNRAFMVDNAAGQGDGSGVTNSPAVATAAAAGNQRTIESSSIPHCVCSWKNCRVYQRFFYGHPVWDGVIQLNFTTTVPEAMALKASIDRNLKVPKAKAEVWTRATTSEETGGISELVCSYTVACHHWTEPHIQKYRADGPERYSFTQPFSFHGAQKYLYKVDRRETSHEDGWASTARKEHMFYLQSPLVPKQEVMDLFYRLRDKCHPDGDDDPHQQALLLDGDDDSSVSSLSNTNRRRRNKKTPVHAEVLLQEQKDVEIKRLTKENKELQATNGYLHDMISKLQKERTVPRDGLLQEKDVEIKFLRTEIHEMQSTLGYLHDMISKLQEERYDQHAATNKKTGPRASAHDSLGPDSERLPRRRTILPGSAQESGAGSSSCHNSSTRSRSSWCSEMKIDESENEESWVEVVVAVNNKDLSTPVVVEHDDEDKKERNSQETFHALSNKDVKPSGSSSSSSLDSNKNTPPRRSRNTVVADKTKSLPREEEFNFDDDDSDKYQEEDVVLGNSFDMLEEIADNEDAGGNKNRQVGSQQILKDDDNDDQTPINNNRRNNNKTVPRDVLLQEKELEIQHSRTEIKEMQSTLGYLHDMVSKRQEEEVYGLFRDSTPRLPRRRTILAGSGGQEEADGSLCRSTIGSPSSPRCCSASTSWCSVPSEIQMDESAEDVDENEIGVEGDSVNKDLSKPSVVEHDEDTNNERNSRVTFDVENKNEDMKPSGSFSSSPFDSNHKNTTPRRSGKIGSSSEKSKSLPRDAALNKDDDSDGWSMQPQANKDDDSDGWSMQSQARRPSVAGRSGGMFRHDESSLSGVYQVTALTMTDPYGEQGTYTGSISNSTCMPHGFGRLEYGKAGRWYEGDWKHGRQTGQGRCRSVHGDFYEGGFKSDQMHGRGVLKFADGRIFEGDYINGHMVDGKMTYQDGSTYTGGWWHGMRHGLGRCVFTDQSVYEGEFRKEEFFGFGKMSWSDGGWYQGEWCNGEMDGFGTEVRPDGSLRHEGQWVKGRPIRN